MKRDPYGYKIRELRAQIPDPEPTPEELAKMPYTQRRKIENAKEALSKALSAQREYRDLRERRRKAHAENEDIKAWNEKQKAEGEIRAKEREEEKRKKKRRLRARPPMAWLNDMQRMFVKGVVHEQMSFTAAARYAGYSHPNDVGPHMARHNPRVVKAITVEREKYAKASGVTKKKVIDGMLEAAEMAKMKSDPTGMVQAWREVGKLCGHYEPTRHEVNVSINGQVMMQRINQMSDEELLALAEKEADGELIDDAEYEEVERPALSTEDFETEEEEFTGEYGVDEEFGYDYTICEGEHVDAKDLDAMDAETGSGDDEH